MKPGRELDVLIAEKVMGEKIGMAGTPPKPFVINGIGCHVEPNEYSTDIAVAWKVVEKLEKDGFNFLVSNNVIVTGLTRLGSKHINAAFGKNQTKVECQTGDSAPHAICLAALKATASA